MYSLLLGSIELCDTLFDHHNLTTFEKLEIRASQCLDEFHYKNFQQ